MEMVYIDKGYIGQFVMSDKTSGSAQLAEYVSQLQKVGHKHIIAPINGDTWHSYRLVSWCNGDPAFPLEPQNPLWYNDIYTDLGFTPIKKYRSDKFGIANIAPPEPKRGLTVRPFHPDDLPLIYDLSIRGFVDNFLYTPIDYADFLAIYQPMLPMIANDLLLIAEVDGIAVGFIFAFVAGDKLILKTMATLPEYRSHGIGSHLMAQVLATGQAKGIKIAIAALMSDDNHSHKIVAKYGAEKIREYTLYTLQG